MDINTRLFIFARDVATREEVKEYFDQYIKGKILERAFAKQDIKDLAEAKELIDGIFAQMEYEVKSMTPDKFVNENE
jgi:hypothetical protein